MVIKEGDGAGRFRLDNGRMAAAFDGQGRLVRLENRAAGHGNVILRPAPGLFRLVAKVGANWENAVFPEAQRYDVSLSGNALTIAADRLVSSHGVLDIGLAMTVTLDGKFLRFDAVLSNRTRDALVTDLFYPVIGDIATLSGGEPDLLWPNHMGERITNAAGMAAAAALTYPGGHGRGASMQWMALCDGDQTLYFSGRDELIHSSQLRAVPQEGEPRAVRLEMLKLPFARPGETWRCPPYILSLYTGSWHEGADEYRAWASGWRRTPTPPRWVRDMQGFFLVINKQQYGEELWPYDTLPELYGHAAANGCDTLGLFGWYDGGHDNTYPEIVPSPTMGGAAGLREALRKVRAAGGRTVMYFQGHLLDLSTEYYRKTGHRLESKSRWGTPYFEQYNKSHNSAFLETYTFKTFSNACPSCPEWQDLLEESAGSIASFGPDGVLFDQIGGMLPYPCFDESHPHPEGRPSLSMVPGRVKALERIRRKTGELQNGDFAFLTEHITDVYSGWADLLHGMYTDPGAAGSRGRLLADRGPSLTVNYPELFRYTFPETIVTIRNGRPFIGHRHENYAFTFALRKEMELRYLDDRTAIREDRHPGERAYSRGVTALRRKFWDILGAGRFLDELPVRNGNRNVVAKAFQAGDRLAVTLWNDTDAEQPLSVEVPGHSLVETAFPDGTSVPRLPGTLASQGIALAVYGKGQGIRGS